MKEKDLESKPWIEKYRPSSLEDIAASHASIVSTLSSFNVNLPHLLFYGPPGTGKTSTVLALARSLYGVSFKSQILELNASDDRGIDVVRNQIQSFASSKSFTQGQVSFKLIILDEADVFIS